MTLRIRPAYVFAMCDFLLSEEIAIKGAIGYDHDGRTGVYLLA